MTDISNWIPKLIIKTTHLLAYFLLIAPPKAKELQLNATVNRSELLGHSLSFVLLSETALRASVFLLIGFSLESLLGNHWYEKYYFDFLFLLLIVSGLIHILSYFLDHAFFVSRNKKLGLLIYRLGRNTCYAIVPSIFAVSCALFYQYYQLQELFSGILVHTIFFVSYLIFVLLGIQEAILASLSPVDDNDG